MNLLLILFVMATEALPPIVGTLCFSEGRGCVPSSGTRIEVAEEDSDRLYVWTSEDGRSVVIGELEAGAGVIGLGLPSSANKKPDVREDRRTLRLSVSGQAARGWPTDVRFTLVESKEKRWVWTLPAGSTRGEMTVHLPVGSSRLFLGARRHRTEMRPIRSEGNLSLGQVELKPLPSISGRVTRVEEEEIVPVAGAQIMLGDGKLAATTNEQGVFRAELSEPVPNEMMVMSPGLSTQVVLLERLEAENDLGEIRLESGVKLTLEVDRPDELRSKSVRVRLLRDIEKRYEHTEVAKDELRPGDETIQFFDLSSGDYFVIFEGEQDFERMLVLIEVRGDDVTRRVEIRPFRLEGTVTLGDDPLSGGKVGISPVAKAQPWRAELPIDSEGGFGGVLWQTGKLRAFVSSPEVSGGMLTSTSPELGSDPSKWPISFRKRLIHGRVFDAESGAGIEGVGFRLQIERADGVRSYSPVKTAASGEYEILAWEDGTYDLIVTSKDHLPKTETVVLADVDG
ncbi:MAG TPA: carboxypeptidase-like regulatory domain-containing protein, partial [Thermoanaerobaculia bacterium]|nr:carboxypeptidase-like regulatory domain-containing protein [Thermoanaerobaculia bacterium]